MPAICWWYVKWIRAFRQYKLEALAQHFKIYSTSGENREFDVETWYYQGTLQEILDGKPIYNGTLTEKTEEAFSVAIAMDTDVDNTFMGYKLEMFLKLHTILPPQST